MLSISFTALAIASAALGAVANILARTLLTNLRSQDILGINFLTMGATLLLLSPLFYFFTPSLNAVLLLLLVAMIDTLANYFYFKTFEKTEASIATPLLSLAPAFTFFFSWMLLDDAVRLQTFLGAIAIIILIIFFSADFKNFKQFHATTLAPALIASVLFGISAIPAKALLDTMDAINAPTLYMFRAGLIALFSLLFFKFSIQHVTVGQYRFIFFRGLFVIAQWLLLYYALSVGNAGVTVTLANITPIFVFLLGAVFLHEKMTLKKSLAAALILLLSLLL